MATPSIYQPPPPPPPPAAKSSLPMLYYGLIVVGTAAIVLALYNIIVIRLCSDRRSQLPQPRPNSSLIEVSRTSLRAGFEDRALPSSFKYKKEKAAMTAAAATAEADSECAVCLSAFEEGEEIRNLPRCKHSFHAPCIDMWLYSHSDCPLCRAPVVVSGAGRCHRHVMSPPEENSREVLLNTTVTV